MLLIINEQIRLRKPGKKNAQSFKNWNVDMPLIVAKGVIRETDENSYGTRSGGEDSSRRSETKISGISHVFTLHLYILSFKQGYVRGLG